MPEAPPHATLVKFGYPRTLLHQGSHWAVLVRPAQATLGSLILCATGEETSYGDLSREAIIEQGELVTCIERVLRQFSDYERINYLMLMMVDPHVHFHVLPRYAGERIFQEQPFPDRGWPALPDLGSTQAATEALVHALRDSWRSVIHAEGEN